MDAPVAGCGGDQEDPDLAGNDANFTDNENDGAQEGEDADIDKVDDTYVDIDIVHSDNEGTAACREDDAASFVDDNFDHNSDDNPGNETGNNTGGDIGDRVSNDCAGIDEDKDDKADHNDIDKEGNNVANIATNHTACRDDCHGRHAKTCTNVCSVITSNTASASTSTTTATATKAFTICAQTNKSATTGTTTATYCIHSIVYRSYHGVSHGGCSGCLQEDL